MHLGKLPPVERDYVGGGLKGDCAYIWALFLKNEADMADDSLEFSKWAAIEEQLRPRPGTPTPSSVHYADLENAIQQLQEKGNGRTALG